MNVELHIDRLVLEGVGLDRRHAGALRAAVVAELTRVLGEPADWTSQAVRTLPAGPLRLRSPIAPTTAGRAIANALHTGLTGTGHH
jgi:hypothetical protein